MATYIGDRGNTWCPRVLLVDDDAALASVLSRSLTHLGMDVTLADDGRKAMQCLDDSRFDVVLLDLQMPNMNGLDMLREASTRADFPATILHSAYVDVPTTVEAMQAGASEVLQKPTSAVDLARRIFQLVGHVSVAADRCAPAPGIEAGEGCNLLLGSSDAMQRVREAVQRVARFRDLSVLVEGATGTGKELVARAIHALGSPDQPLVSINCAAIPAELFESELFGHDAGAFTSARRAHVGLLEEAGEGVLFLDEVGELPLGLQAKLLRVLETREYRRVGSGTVRRFAARVVSATNRSLGELDGEHFRADLYFRIAGHTIRTPELREHREDIPALAAHFCREFCGRHGTAPVRIGSAAMERLCAYHWPGNVRQLRAVVHNAIVLTSGSAIDVPQLAGLLPGGVAAAAPERCAAPSGRAAGGRSLPDVERDLIHAAYRDTGGNLTRAAERLGIPRTTLRDRLRRYGLR